MIFVAELGSLHKRDRSLAYESMRQAKLAGADIAKFQFGWPADDEKRHIDHWARDLKAFSEDLNIELMVSVFTAEAVIASRIAGVDRLKVPAIKANDIEIIDAVRAENKLTYVSGKVYDWAVPIWCVSKYPTYPWDLEMPKAFGDPWQGYSDHAHGIEACLIAIARGATYIEAHFGMDPSDLWTRDSPFAKTPSQFAELVTLGRRMSHLVETMNVQS